MYDRVGSPPVSADGRLAELKRIVLVRGVVNAAEDFVGHTQVIDCASEVFVNVFGDTLLPLDVTGSSPKSCSSRWSKPPSRHRNHPNRHCTNQIR
jgi:hypothetical protein